MTQPKKPQPKATLTYDNIDFAAGYNHGLFEMDAYYKPIVKELVEALKDLSDSIDDGTTLSGQRLENVDKIIAKYKAIK
jgi:hypothetical protein